MTTIKRLYNRFKMPTEEVRLLRDRADANWDKLRKKLTRKQRILLLRIIDDKDMIRELSSFDSFEQGFRLGMRLGGEIHGEEEPDEPDLLWHKD